MTVKDQIPSFPDLISVHAVRNYIAHGTNDYKEIARKYYSMPEREHAEELAETRIVELLRDGMIRATGRISELKQGNANRWQIQRYKKHSKIRQYIDTEFWQDFVFVRASLFKTSRNPMREFTDIMLVVDDCRVQLADDIVAHKEAETNSDDVASREEGYSTPYINLMWQAIDEFNITAENQPIKETLVEWFLEQEIAGQKLSHATANYLASFVRLPESRTGGNRPWRVRAQRDHESAQ